MQTKRCQSWQIIQSVSGSGFSVLSEQRGGAFTPQRVTNPSESGAKSRALLRGKRVRHKLGDRGWGPQGGGRDGVRGPPEAVGGVSSQAAPLHP